MLGAHEGSPRLNLQTLDCWREISSIAWCVKGIVSHPNRRLGIAMFDQSDIASSMMSGPSLAILIRVVKADFLKAVREAVA